MRLDRACLLMVALAGLSCKHVASPPAEPSVQTVQPVTSSRCVASLSESRDALVPFPDGLVRDGVKCEAFQWVEERHCPSMYVAIADQGGYGGSTRYFDGDRKLIGVWVQSDTNQYCNGASFDILYGVRPTCPTAEIVTNLCRR